MVLKYAGEITLTPEEVSEMKADQKDFEWWADNWQTLWRKHRGHYIAICNCRVVAAGQDPAEVRREADSQYPGRGIPMVFMPPEIRKKIL